MRIVVVRNGVIVREFRDQELVCDEYCANKHVTDFKDLGWANIACKTLSIFVGTLLEKRDQVWVEVYRSAHEAIENGEPWFLRRRALPGLMDIWLAGCNGLNDSMIETRETSVDIFF